ncbi:MAG TPA: LCP family protein, partial [Ilumatobacteraceae bacterium]|nr:LCP family protein [Ilumatobacteraceae bacterium]
GEGGEASIGDRTSLGERSDTIMIMRVNPETSQAAILSFPRDLYVDLAGTNRKGKINWAYKVDDPQNLIDTIQNNFYVP